MAKGKGRVVVDVTNTNWRRLRRQKLTILRILEAGRVGSVLSHLDGVIHFLDHVQDSAAEQIGEEAVFGKMPKASKRRSK